MAAQFLKLRYRDKTETWKVAFGHSRGIPR
jgi:hypothetical protein